MRLSAQALIPAVDAMLRNLAERMLEGDALSESSAACYQPKSEASSDLVKCLVYLRDRIGVPRDMAYPSGICVSSRVAWKVLPLFCTSSRVSQVQKGGTK